MDLISMLLGIVLKKMDSIFRFLFEHALPDPRFEDEHQLMLDDKAQWCMDVMKANCNRATYKVAKGFFIQSTFVEEIEFV